MKNDKYHLIGLYLRSISNAMWTVTYDNECNNYTMHVYVDIFARRKFSPISPPSLIGENFLSCIKDHIEDIVTFTALAKTILCTYFLGLVKFFTYTVMLYVGCDDTAGHQEATQASAVGNKGNLSGQLL